MDCTKQMFGEIPLYRTLGGIAQKTVDFLTQEQYLDAELWKKFVNQYRIRPDGADVGWRGEFWGKAMRGAVMVYQASRNEALYAALTESVKDMLTVADPDGKVTTYVGEHEFHYWDIWSRKYVMLGMEYYYAVCRDEALKAQIIPFISGCADDILKHVGRGEGMVCITDSHKWRGVNSSSVMEPMVRLYRLTGEKKYLDFVEYIISEGGADGIKIFEMALQNEKMPYQYSVSKAYEVMSCFEGIVEYYLVTGDEKYKKMAIQFGEAVLKTEVTAVGSCGCTHELFDHAAARQTAPYDGVMQETCVTVTWMKFCVRMLCLTGNATYADQIELSWYNALLGAVNTEKRISDFIYYRFVTELGYPGVVDSFLPFDSYSPLTAGKRGQKLAGNQIFADLTYFGCCASIGGAGVGAFLNNAVMESRDGLVINFYEGGTTRVIYGGEEIEIQTVSNYPADGKVRIQIKRAGMQPLSIRCRIPEWSEKTEIKSDFGGFAKENGYAVWDATQADGVIELNLDMSLRMEFPQNWGTDQLYVEYERPAYRPIQTTVTQSPEELNYVCIHRGPIVLAMDSDLGIAADAEIKPNTAEAIFAFDKLLKTENGSIDAMVVCDMPDEKHGKLTLVDYASAGKNWTADIAAWLKYNRA